MRQVAFVVGLVACMALAAARAQAACSQYDRPLGSTATVQIAEDEVIANAHGQNYQTLSAIISVESSGWPWTINDNAPGGCSYYLPSEDLAVSVAMELNAAGHTNLDLGVAQINEPNLAGLEGRVPRVLGPKWGTRAMLYAIFDPSTNVAAGAYLLEGCWQRVIGAFGVPWVMRNPTPSVRAAVGCYNTHSIFEGKDYVQKVVEAAYRLPMPPAIALQKSGSSLPAGYALRAASQAQTVPPAPAQAVFYEWVTHE